MSISKTSKTTTSPKETPTKQDKQSFHFSVHTTDEEMKKSILNHLTVTLARDINTATRHDFWLATCYAVRDRVLERFMKTMSEHHKQNVRRVYYLSLEYLMGRLLNDNIYNAGLDVVVKNALSQLGMDYDAVCDEEMDMGLGNGGLGRLAACFLDSLATLELPAVGYGIHYEFGLFRQEFRNCRQIERADNWLQYGNPWQIVRPEYTKEIHLYGNVENTMDDTGKWRPKWVNTQKILGVPWDVPIVGYGAKTVNFLRLWESRATNDFDFQLFNEGSYTDAVQEKARGETISKVLYPNDSTESGKELRLVQQYFFVSCSLQDIIRRYKGSNTGWDAFPEKAAIQLNDTHPSLGVAELMRILVDEEKMDWAPAWNICRKVFGYTNHTLLPEALERWSVPLFEKVLPRHLQIIYEINSIFLSTEVEAKWPGDGSKKAELSLIEEGTPKKVRMAYLSVVGSHAVNGVAALHTKLLKENLFNTFDQLYPTKIQNKTNGITPRRWLKACNHGLSDLIDSKLGPHGWAADLDKLRELEKYADDKAFQKAFMQVKLENKKKLAVVIKERCGIVVDPTALFDVQIKRLHEYKRQHLNLLHILTLYRRLLHDPKFDIHPRVFIFGAKAAPGYWLAKEIIHTINRVGEVINNDARIKGKLKIAFIPNYGVTLAQHIIPAADLSEQISTAGKEASGTGNMKLALNGALTIGTMDGANVEIDEEVGRDNIFIFGLLVEEVEALVAKGYNPWDYYNSNGELKAVLDWMGSDHFTPGNPNGLMPLRESLLNKGDPFLCLADYADYCRAQAEVDAAYRNPSRWAKMAILNTARVGKFSSDRTIREYANEIWNLKSIPVA